MGMIFCKGHNGTYHTYHKVDLNRYKKGLPHHLALQMEWIIECNGEGSAGFLKASNVLHHEGIDDKDGSLFKSLPENKHWLTT